jgi:predicted RND superfamily exporter protein
LLIAQLGILTVIAISSSYLITITFIPAALRLNPRAKAHEYRPSPMMGAIARFVSRYRIAAIAVILVVTAILLPATALVPIEAFGDPPRNWLASDPLRQEHEKAIQGFYNSAEDDVKANILIFEGNINDPRAHRYMDAIEAELKRYAAGSPTLPVAPFVAGDECEGDARGQEGRIIQDTLRTLPFFVRTYLTVRNGVPGAGQFLALENLGSRTSAAQREYPQTEAALSALLDEAQRSPLRGLGQLFYDHPDDEMAMMLFSVKAASYEEAREVWCQVQSVLKTPSIEALRPTDLRVSFFGNTAINYLFVAKELPWVGYMSIVDNILVMAFVYLPTRLIRPTILVGVLNFLAGVWWFALLPQFGVGQAITLTLPLVFIYAIGSDYGLHLALNAISLNNTEEAFRTTGKGVLFSGITTFGAFLIYTQMSNVAVQRTMIATAAAIPIIFLVTMLVVPVLYPVGKRFRKEHKTLEQVEHVALEEEPIESEPSVPEPAPEPPVERQRIRVPAVVVEPKTAVVRKKRSSKEAGRRRRTR